MNLYEFMNQEWNSEIMNLGNGIPKPVVWIQGGTMNPGVAFRIQWWDSESSGGIQNPGVEFWIQEQNSKSMGGILMQGWNSEQNLVVEFWIQWNSESGGRITNPGILNLGVELQILEF